jgi:hypothetical protein
VLALFCVVSSVTAQIVTNPVNGHAYQFVRLRGEVSWHDARAAAEERGGYLMTITDPIESDIATAFLDGMGAEAWLGGTDEAVEGVWTWVTGEPWDYTNWYPGEPNAAYENEDYLLCQYATGGAWNDAGTPQTGYIVEFDSPVDTILQMIQWREEDGGNNHWYALLPTMMSWDEANAVAGSFRRDGHDGHLATVTGQAENDFVLNNVIPFAVIDEAVFFTPEYWLGGIGYESFTWVTGEPFEYTNWAEGHPHDMDTVEALAMVGFGWDFNPPFPGQWVSRAPQCEGGMGGCRMAIVEFDTEPSHVCRNLRVPEQFPTIMAAIEEADDCDRILVSPGVYFESLNFMGKNIQVRSTDGPQRTVITNDRTVDLVTFENGETRRAVLDGFTLQGGWMAVVIAGSAPTVSHNICVGQNVWNWAAIGLIGELVRMTDPTGDPRYTGSIGPAGAAIINNTIIYSANGGLSMFSSVPPTVRNNIIAFNENYGVHQQSLTAQPPPDIDYNDVYGQGEFNGGPYGDYINIPDPGAGSIRLDPMFNRSFGLTDGSPCIDAGDPRSDFNDPDGTRNDMGAVFYRQEPGGGVVPTNEWIVTFCQGPGYTLPVEPPVEPVLIQAFDPDGVLCGQDWMMEDGTYGFMPVYRDDPETDLDEGAEPGDLISFRLNDIPVTSDPEVYWTANGDIYEVCSFGQTHCQEIPLHAGWNLISWNLAYAGPVEEAFADILPLVDVILTFENGGLIFDTRLPEFSTLDVVDYHHAYWIRVLDDMVLSICGEEIPPGETIGLEAGWNLAAYWPMMDFPVEEALVSLGVSDSSDNLQQVMGFDQGAQIWVPSMGNLNTLTVMRPGFGFWMKVRFPADLDYPPFGGLDPDDFELGGNRIAPVASTVDETSRSWMAVYGRSISVDGVPLGDGAQFEFANADGQVCGRGTYANGMLKMSPVYGYDESGDVAKSYPKEGEAVSVYVDGERVFPNLMWGGNGSRVNISALTADSRGLPHSYLLKPNYPNPFNPSTNISFELPINGHVRIDIFNMLGQRVRTVTDRDYLVGRHSVEWDGTDESGESVATGVYFYRMTSGDVTSTKKMMMLK